MSDENLQAQEATDLSVESAASLLEQRLFGVEPPQESAEEKPPEDPAPSETEASEETDEAESEPEIPAIAAPLSWSAEDKATFSKLPPDAQAVIAKRESEREKFVSTKANELAQERQAITAERQRYATQLSSFLQNLQSQVTDEFANVDWQKLAEEDPAGYVALRAKAEQKFIAIQQTRAEQERINQAQRQEAEAQAKTFLDSEMARLREDPDFAAPDKAKATVAAMGDYLVKMGVPKEEHGALKTAASMRIVRDAMRYHQLQTAKPAVEKKVSAPAKVVKPGASSGRDESDDGRRQAALKGNLRKTGSVKDAAAFLESIL